MTSEKQVLSPMIFEEQYDQDILAEQVQQLGLKIDKSKDEIEDKKELFYILNRLLSYPSTVLAETHRSANRLGMFDVNSEERYKRITDIVHRFLLRILEMRKNLRKYASVAGLLSRKRI